MGRCMTLRSRNLTGGVPDVLEVSYRAHLPAIVRYLRRRLGDVSAEDAASDVFLRALQAERAGTTVSLPWLFGVAANVISERRRSERRRLRAIERLSSETAVAGEDRPHRVDMDPDLIRGLRRLSHEDREALLLVAWGDLSYEQTAEALGIPVGTVRSRLHRARKQLGSTASAGRTITQTTTDTARSAHA